MEEQYAATTVAAAIRQFKSEHCGRTDFTLHSADLVRARGAFRSLRHPGRRAQAFEDLNRLMHSLEYTVLACTVSKSGRADMSAEWQGDVYHICFQRLIDRFCDVIGPRIHGGRVVVERRDPVLDAGLEREWGRIRKEGIEDRRALTIRRRISRIELHNKGDRIAGLELADLVVSPIGRHILGKVDHEDWRIISSKLHPDPNGLDGRWGLINL